MEKINEIWLWFSSLNSDFRIMIIIGILAFLLTKISSNESVND